MKEFIESIRACTRNQNWFAALFIALAIPDICGYIDTGSMNTGQRYRDWFNRYLLSKYGRWFTADDCYYFRCACLHQGLDEHPSMAYERIHLITPPLSGTAVHSNQFFGSYQMQIDIFCEDMCLAVEQWLEDVANNGQIQARLQALIRIHNAEESLSAVGISV